MSRRHDIRYRSLSARTPIIKNANKASNILNNTKKQYPRLSSRDSTQRSALKREFSPYSALAEYYYTTQAKVAAYLRAHLNSASVIASSALGSSSAVVANPGKANLNYLEIIKEYTKKSSSSGRFLKIVGDQVVVSLEPLSFEIGLVFNEESAADFGAKMRKLFGSFTVPTRTKQDDTGNFQIDFEGVDYNTGRKSVDFFTNLKFVKDEGPNKYQPDKLSLDPVDVRVARATGLEVRITETRSRRFGSLPAQAGDLKNTTIYFTFQVMGIINFPLEYALWATNATTLTEFVPKLFREHFDKIGQLQTKVGNSGVYKLQLARTMHLGVIKTLNDERIKEFGITIQPRSNEDNFCILKNGNINYTPQVDRTDEYVKVLRDSYNPTDGLIKHNSEIPEIKNQPLLTDWINDAFSYTDTSGKPTSLSLSGAIPLDPVTIARYLRMPLGAYNADFIENVGKLGGQICAEFGLYSTNNTPDMYVASNYAQLFYTLARGSAGELPFSQAIDIAYSTDEQAQDLSETNRKLLIEFVRLSSGIAQNLMNSSIQAYIRRCEYMFTFYVFGKYVSKRATFRAEAETSLIANSPVLPKDSFEIPNSPGFTKVLPHQAEAITQSGSENPPIYMSFEVSAGGGKTSMLFADIMLLKAKGKIKTALVVCPGNLVKEWTSEVNRMCRGKVNLVPITTNVVIKLHKHMGFDKKAFIDYLKSAPPNTIFVVSLNFLRGTTDHFTGERYNTEMQYGEDFIKFYPNVQLLRQLNPDLIAVDESHKIKNNTSDVTKAFFALSPVAKYRRIASGTMSPDNPLDIVTQTAVLNPAIFGSKANFLANYGIEQNGKFIGLQPGESETLTKVRQPYMARIYKTRSEWSFLIPDLSTSIVECHMTANQMTYYNIMISQAMKELRNDPKIQELRSKADGKQSAELEKMLDTKLGLIELFVNAPDEDKIFINQSDIKLTDDDLISCKVREVDSLLNEHFNERKSKHKVIVFGINIKVSRHIFRHTRFQNVAMHYAVKNSLSGVSAGDALLKFRNDPKYRVLIADATSMREGLNLQLADMVIYTQTEWSPGNQEQAIARAMRPDVFDVYKRTDVYVKKLAAKGTYEVAKIAKLINKEVVNLDVGNVSNPEWKKYTKDSPIPQLQPITLSLNLIEEVREFDHPLVRSSMACYASINEWEQREFDRCRKDLTIKTANRLGVDNDKINLRRDALLPVDGSATLPNSKSIFVPLESGAVPVDKRNLNLMPIAILKIDENEDGSNNDNEEDIDEDKAELQDNVTYSEGDLVQTEYGFGKIVKILTNQVRVSIPGFRNGEPITIYKQVVFKPATPGDSNPTLSNEQWEENLDRLKKDVRKAGTKGILFTQGYDNVQNTPSTPPTINKPIKPAKLPPHPSAKDEPEEQETVKPNKPVPRDTLPTSSKAELDIVPLVINGVPSLTAYTDEAGFKKLQANHGNWFDVPPFFAAHVKTFNGAQRLAKAITDAGLTVLQAAVGANGKRPPDQLSRMLGLAKKMRGGATDPALLIRNGGAASVATGLKNFFIIAHSKVNDPNTVKVYPIIYNDELFLCAPITVQTNQANTLKNLKVAGVGKFTKYSSMAIQMYASPAKAKVALKRMGSEEKIANLNEANELINHALFNKLSGL